MEANDVVTMIQVNLTDDSDVNAHEDIPDLSSLVLSPAGEAGLDPQGTAGSRGTAANAESDPSTGSDEAHACEMHKTSRECRLKPKLVVSTEDTVIKMLPGVLKKYHLDELEWKNMVLFLVYGPSTGRVERCLSYNEKPLYLFQKLKDQNKDPVFMLKHVKDIRSPIQVAKEKIMARKASKSLTSEPTSLNSISADTPTTTGPTHSSGWPEMPVPAGNVTYAVAVYPYMAEQDDEFDVSLGDTYVILFRQKKWCTVQRDPSGCGILEADCGKVGWVPAGCFLEMNCPAAFAYVEALSPELKANAIADNSNSKSDTPTSELPILWWNVITTAFSGVAVLDYKITGEAQVDLQKNDPLKVYKRYNHWTYVIKVDGKRGWVPSWFIGKVRKASHSGDTGDTPQEN